MYAYPAMLLRLQVKTYFMLKYLPKLNVIVFDMKIAAILSVFIFKGINLRYLRFVSCNAKLFNLQEYYL